MLGSFAGALYAHLIGYINPESFTVDLSTNFVIMLMVGGILEALDEMLNS